MRLSHKSHTYVVGLAYGKFHEKKMWISRDLWICSETEAVMCMSVLFHINLGM